MSEAMEMWTIYDHPHDYPDHFVARKFIGVNGEPCPTGTWKYAKTLDAVRDMIPWGLMCFPRQPGDHPTVVETWM